MFGSSEGRHVKKARAGLNEVSRGLGEVWLSLLYPGRGGVACWADGRFGWWIRG